MVYAVVVLRTDGDHITVIESPDYDKCYEKWKMLQNEWATASKEQRPFTLEDPIVTAFNPSLTYEIRLIPVMPETMANKNNNPYAQRMGQEGFGRTFPGKGGMDLL